MKKIIVYTAALLFTVSVTSITGCKKKKDETSSCKTCKALASGPDQQTVTQEVCGTQAEQDFRSQYAGREITCQ